MGVSAMSLVFRMVRQTSKPFFLGITTSEMIRSGFSLMAFSTAISPFSAEIISAFKSRSMISSSMRIFDSSSAIRIFVMVRVLVLV